MINLGNIELADLRLGASQVKAAYFGSKQIWGGEEPAPIGDALCFTAEQNGSTLRLDKEGSPGTIYLETSDDGGASWKDYTWSGNTGDQFGNLNVGDKVYFRAKTENQTIGNNSFNYYKFVMSGKIAASGNIQTLLKADGSRTDAPSYCYSNIFNGCKALTTAPELPAMTLATQCYASVFYRCSSLSAAPELPATTLAYQCYINMFQYCSSLTAAPELPATTLADSCYSGMFKGCTSLTIAPALPATTLAGGCYYEMFNGCSSLSSVEVAFTAWNPTNATQNWVNGVAASGTFTCPAELPDIRGTNNIPTGWNVVHPVEYIEANSQQYLNTGYAPQVGDEIEITWANTDNTKENKGFLVGSYWSGGGRVANGQIKPWIFPGITGGGFSTPSNFYTNDMVIGEKFTDHMYVGTLASGRYGYTMYRHLTDTLYSYNEWSGSARNENISLCGASGDTNSMANKRIYGWKHWRNGALIRDMIPINYNGVGAMYDNVSQIVFTSGSGVDFLLPNPS